MSEQGGVLTGRDEELAFARDVLTGSGRAGLVIRGPAGVGKSRLAEEIVRAMAPAMSVLRVAGSGEVGGVPFGAFAHLLPEDRRGADVRLEPPGLLDTVRDLRAALRELSDGRPLLLVVDDAHLLGPASTTLVQQLVIADGARAVLTVRIGEPCPDPIVDLWKDEHCELVELQPLARDEVGALVAEELGAWFDQQSLDRFFTASGGNPLFVRELLRDARSTGGLRTERGLVTWEGVAGTPRLATVVERHLSLLDAAEQDVIDLLAVGEPLPVAAARQLASSEVLASLESSELISVDRFGDACVRFAHPLFGEVRRARLGPLALEAVQRRLADAFEVTGARRAEDRLRLIRWRLAVGDAVSPADLRAGAELARAAGDLDRAEQLARRARVEGPGSAALDLMLAEILELQGAAGEAAELLAGLAEGLDADQQRARALTTQIRVLAHVLGRFDEAEAVAGRATLIGDDAWRGYVSAQWATTLAMHGRLDAARPLGDELFAHGDDRVRLRALPAVNLTALCTGNVESALASAQSMIGPALTWRDEVPAATGIVLSALALDLLALGRLDEIDSLLELVGGDPSARLPANRAYLLFLEGTLALRRGQVGMARRTLAESVSLFGRADPQGYLPAALSTLAEAAALAGDGPGASAVATEATDLSTGRPARLIEVESARCRAWVPTATGDRAAARRALLAVADHAAGAGAPTFELVACHDAVRLGAGAATQRRVVALSDRVDGERAGAMAADCSARLAGDVDGMTAAATRFEATGELLVAAELMAAAARRAHDEGRTGQTGHLAARARALAGRCTGAVLDLDLLATGAVLTPRELQVARLAADGRASREIAEELVVSRRTVDNQLSRVYAKLGVGGRGELSAALARLGDELST